MNTIILLAILLLIAVLLVIINSLKKLKFFSKNINQNIAQLRLSMLNLKSETKNRDYNARKRDEKLLREFRKMSRQENGHYGSICDSLADNNIKLDGIAKLCRGIENVTRGNINNDINIKSGITQIKKCQKEAGRILNLFEETLTKAKTGRGK